MYTDFLEAGRRKGSDCYEMGSDARQQYRQAPANTSGRQTELLTTAMSTRLCRKQCSSLLTQSHDLICASSPEVKVLICKPTENEQNQMKSILKWSTFSTCCVLLFLPMFDCKEKLSWRLLNVPLCLAQNLLLMGIPGCEAEDMLHRQEMNISAWRYVDFWPFHFQKFCHHRKFLLLFLLHKLIFNLVFL
jgi:hypothetical protein